MKRFIITEEEKNRIRTLYEKIGEKLTPESLNSKKAQNTKKIATSLNSYYKINLSAAQTGSWTDKDYNDTLKKFMEEKGIQVWICKKGDGWCSNDGNDEGEVTTKELDKLYAAFSQQKNTNLNPKGLKFGDRGPDVTELQKRLKLTDPKTGKPLYTGYFGKITQAALNKAEGKTQSSNNTTTNQNTTRILS
jgi:hypothetical protein